MQTKLSNTEKASVRHNLEMLRAEGGDVFSFPKSGVTVAIAPVFTGSRMALASVAIMADSEKKFRKLVGVNEAMYKHENGEGVQMALSPDYWIYSKDEQNSVLKEMAANLAFAVIG